MGESRSSASHSSPATHVERQLHRALEELRIIVESMGAPVTRCSRDLKYVWASQPYADWLQLSVDDIVGRPIADVAGPDVFSAIRPHFDRVLSGERVEYEERLPYLGRGLRWVKAIYTPTFDASQSVDGWVAIV